MTPAFSRTETNGTRRAGALFRALAVAGLLAAAMPWAGAAQAAAGSTAHGGAGADGAEAAQPIFGLPPIVATVLQKGDPEPKTVVFKADLVFDEVEDDRIQQSIGVTKSLLPRIMDSVITGIEGKQFDDLKNLASINDVVVARSNEVLKPYGVVVKSLHLVDLSRPAVPAE